ncbi:unnamed protein product [Calicophoron daubneyi]
MEDKNKRPRKSGSSKPKRPRLLYKCSVTDPPTTEEECQSRTGLNAGPDLSVIHPHNNHQNGCLANGLSRNATSTASPPSVTNADSITGGTLINHSVTGCDSLLGRHNMNSTVMDYSPAPKLSPLKLSRVKRPDSDLTSRSDAKRHSHRRVKQQMTSGGEELGRNATDPCSTPASVTDSSETAFDPQPTSANHSSLPGSTLSSVQTCHLTPLSTSFGVHPRRFSESNSNERSDDRWTSPQTNGSAGSTPCSNASGADPPNSIRPSGSSSKPCHLFSVAALTDEQPSKHHPEIRKISASDSSHPDSARNSVSADSRLSNCRSTHASPSNTPLPQASPSSISSTRTRTDSSHSAPVGWSSGVCVPSSVRSSFDHPSFGLLSHPTVTTLSHSNRTAKDTTDSLENGPKSGHTSQIKNRQSLPKPQRVVSTLPSSSFSSSVRSDRPLTSMADSGAAMRVSLPSSRVLQQLIGVSSDAAERLLTDYQFKELCSKAISSLTGMDGHGMNSSFTNNNSHGSVANHKRKSNERERNQPFSMSSPFSLPNMPVLMSSPSSQPVTLGRSEFLSSQPPTSNARSVCHSLIEPGSASGSQLSYPPPYGDRGMINRMVSAAEDCRRSRDAYQSSMNPSISILPTPPPLTAGCNSTDSKVSGQPSDLSALHRTHVRPPPPPPLYNVHQRPSALSSSSRPDFVVPVTSPLQPPLLEFLDHSTQSHWENYFRKMLGGESWSSPEVSASDGSALSHAPKLPTSVSSSQPGSNPVTVPPPRHMMGVAPRPGGLAVPRYHLNSLFNIQQQPPPQPQQPQPSVRPLCRPLHPGMTNSLARIRPTQCSVLHTPTHPDKGYGRWADAHIRVAVYISRYQCSQKAGSKGRKDLSNPPKPPVRPIPRHPLSLLPRLPTELRNSIPLDSTCRMPSLPQPINFQPSAYPFGNPQFLTPTSSVPFDSLAEKTSFWNMFISGLMSNVPGEIAGGNIPSKEAFELLCRSALQQKPPAPSAPVPAIPSSLQTGSLGSSAVTSNMSVVGPGLMDNGFLASSSKPLGVSPLLAQPAAPPPPPFYPSGNHSLTSSMSAEAESKRRMLDHAMYDSSNNGNNPLAIPLLNRLPRPSDLPGSNKADVIHAAASILNGYQIPEMYMNPTNPGCSQVRPPTDMTGHLGMPSNLKMGKRPSHLAPIHPW